MLGGVWGSYGGFGGSLRRSGGGNSDGEAWTCYLRDERLRLTTYRGTRVIKRVRSLRGLKDIVGPV